jgi:hypothetical protein
MQTRWRGRSRSRSDVGARLDVNNAGVDGLEWLFATAAPAVARYAERIDARCGGERATPATIGCARGTR